MSAIAAAAAAALLPVGPAAAKHNWLDDLDNLEYLQIRNERRVARMHRDFLKEALEALGERAEDCRWKKEEWATWNPPRRIPGGIFSLGRGWGRDAERMRRRVHVCPNLERPSLVPQ